MLPFPSLPFPSFPPLPSLPFLPCHEADPEHQLGGMGSAVSSRWGQGRSLGCKRILVYFELENRTWRQRFFYKKKTAVSAGTAGTALRRSKKLAASGIS